MSVLATLLFVVSCMTVAPDKKIEITATEKEITKPIKSNQHPYVRSTLKVPQSGYQLYDDGEDLFNRGNYQASYQRFAEFVNRELVDNAYVGYAIFKAGIALFEMERYRLAADYFLKAAEINTAPNLSVESIINLGICHYILLKYDKAAELFTISASKTDETRLRAYITYYRGLLAEKNHEYHEAALQYLTTDLLAVDENLVTNSRSKLLNLYKNFLTDDQLKEITESYPNKWGAQYAFKELFSIYERRDLQDELEEVKQLYAAQFEPTRSIDQEGCNENSEQFRSDAPKIGVVIPVSGSSGDIGRELMHGIQLATYDYNDLIMDQNIKIVIKDSRGDPARAFEESESLATDQDVVGIVGPAYSTALSLVSKVSKSSCIPFLSPSASQEGLASISPWLFRNGILDSMEAKKLSSLVLNQMGLKRIAIIYLDHSASARLTAYFRAFIESSGGEVAAIESFEMDQTDFSKQIRAIGGMKDSEIRSIILDEFKLLLKENPREDEEDSDASSVDIELLNKRLATKFNAKRSTPQVFAYEAGEFTKDSFQPGLVENYDALFVIGPYDKTGLIMPQISFYNINNVAKFVSRSSNDYEFIKIGERFTEGVIFVDSFFPDSNRKEVNEFVRKYKLAFGTNPTRLAAQSYDAMKIVLEGVIRGAKSRRALTDYLSNLKEYAGVTGITSIGPTGDAEKELYYLTVKKKKIVEFSKDNPPILVKKFELAKEVEAEVKEVDELN